MSNINILIKLNWLNAKRRGWIHGQLMFSFLSRTNISSNCCHLFLDFPVIVHVFCFIFFCFPCVCACVCYNWCQPFSIVCGRIGHICNRLIWSSFLSSHLSNTAPSFFVGFVIFIFFFFFVPVVIVVVIRFNFAFLVWIPFPVNLLPNVRHRKSLTVSDQCSKKAQQLKNH